MQQGEFLRWTEYVYLWVCTNPESAYIKVGVTNNPDRRAGEFKTNSPLKPNRHLICQCPDRDAAFRLEGVILAAYSLFAVKGEWIEVPLNLVDGVIRACSKIAQREVSPKVGFRFHKPKLPEGSKRFARTASSRAPRQSQGSKRSRPMPEPAGP